MRKKSKSTFLIIPFLVLCGCLLSSDLNAQTYLSFRNEQQDIIQNRSRIRIGPFRIYPRIQISDIGYDGNVLREEDKAKSISDFTLNITPSVQMSLLFSNWVILTVTESVNYRHFFNTTRERAWDNSIMPTMKILLFNRFVLSGRYFYRTERRRGTTEFDVRAKESSHQYHARLMYETTRGTTFGFSGEIRELKWEDLDLPGEEITLSRRLNRRELSGDFEFYYPFTSRSRFFVRAGATKHLFESSEAEWRDSLSYEVSTGLIFPLLGNIRGTFSLGYKVLKPDSTEIKKFSGLIGNTTLTFRMGRFNFNAQYLRDSHFSFSSTNLYFVQDRYSPGVSFYLTRFLKLNYTFHYGINSYPEPELLDVTESGPVYALRKDIHKSHSATMTVRIIRLLGIALTLKWWEVDSNFPLRGKRDQLFMGFSITHGF
ncbi:outer membrane beta-barrel protein [Acidobacteriota bacterium]